MSEELEKSRLLVIGDQWLINFDEILYARPASIEDDSFLEIVFKNKKSIMIPLSKTRIGRGEKEILQTTTVREMVWSIFQKRNHDYK